MRSTIRFDRVLRDSPEKVYRAYLDPDAMSKWLPPHGFTGKIHHMDARFGGSCTMSFTNLSANQSHSFGGTYMWNLSPRTDAQYLPIWRSPSSGHDGKHHHPKEGIMLEGN